MAKPEYFVLLSLIVVKPHRSSSHISIGIIMSFLYAGHSIQHKAQWHWLSTHLFLQETYVRKALSINAQLLTQSGSFDMIV